MPTTTIAQGVSKQTRIARQTGKGSLAATGGGQILARKSSVFELKKDTFDTSDQITSTQQLTSVQHGAVEIDGSIAGLLSPGTYADPLSAIVRRDFAAFAALTGLSLTISGSGPSYTVARGTGSWLTDGIKVGYVIRLSVGALNAANTGKNLLVVNVTALSLTVMPFSASLALVAEGPITGCTVSVPGKVTYVPKSGHTKIYHTVEEWYPDLATPLSEVNGDVVFGSAQLTLPGSGNATIDFKATGLSQTQGSAAYFTNPTTESTSAVASAPMGVMMAGGNQQLVITNLQFTVDGQAKSADPVVGTTQKPDVFRSKVKVTGQITGYLMDAALSTSFIGATDIALVGALPNGAGAAADFIAYCMPAVKLTSATPDDNETGLKRTYNFTAEYYAAGGAGAAYEQTTIQFQDSLAA